MNKRLTLVSLSAGLLLAACGTAPRTDATSGPSPDTAASLRQELGSKARLSAVLGQTLPDAAALAKTGNEGDTTQELVVGYGDRAFVDRLAAHLGAQVRDDLPQLRLALLVLPENLSVKRAAAVLMSRPVSGLRYAEANGHAGELPKVIRGGSLSSQSLTPQADSDPLSVKQWWIRQIQADQVRGISTGAGVIVGVIDDDFDRLHEDLKAPGKIVTGYDTSNGKELTPDMPLTSGDHGSGSAGTIAERLGNGVGGAGVAPDAILMPIRIFTEKGYTTDFGVAKGFVYAVDHGARVLNNSWGGGGYTQVIKDAVDYALSKKVVVVGSAGNDHANQFNGPGSFTGVINVGASAGDDMKADFSNLGPQVDLYAPGENGLTTYIDETLTTPRESRYGLFSGTSMAAPVVSGAAALLLQLNKDLTPYQIKELLARTGDPMKDPRTQGFNRVNVKSALAALQAGQIPADGGAVEVQVVDISEGSPISGTDVILTPLDGQNKGLNYFGRTGNGQLEDTVNQGKDPKARVQFSGVARFFGVEPGRYRVSVAGPSVNEWGGTRDSILGEITVASGGKPLSLNYAHQVDFYEYSVVNKTLQRNNSQATATDLTGIPTAAFADGLLFGGAFDSENFVYADPVTGPDVDYLKFTVGAGQTLTVEGYAALLGSKANVKVDLLNASGAVVAAGKAVAGAVDSLASFKAPTAGVYTVRFTNTTPNEGLGAFYTSVVTIK
ncbi:serine protease, subtilase family9 [Deinococcus aerius]|uniref:Serine protease, subtilase family9 n=1 Tax=Deinococcus aerius TaxID=200253 RepID=A0A2I9D065_9DEIO|nr:S8 family serine peptidase [Deinococcus aerius]GBF07899.1 serine protease, subtilase family9 [Deinococcus aerius]